MQHYWFKPKRYGLGAYPASWQGWALTVGYLALMLTLSAWLGSKAVDAERHLTSFFFIATALTLVFAVIAWRTTEGGWRWRWGGKD
ncbi:MAG: hypothetical protein R3C30_13820 [Hyphomonadaceae bacterium]